MSFTTDVTQLQHRTGTKESSNKSQRNRSVSVWTATTTSIWQRTNVSLACRSEGCVLSRHDFDSKVFVKCTLTQTYQHTRDQTIVVDSGKASFNNAFEFPAESVADSLITLRIKTESSVFSTHSDLAYCGSTVVRLNAQGRSCDETFEIEIGNGKVSGTYFLRETINSCLNRLANPMVSKTRVCSQSESPWYLRMRVRSKLFRGLDQRITRCTSETSGRRFCWATPCFSRRCW